MLRATVALFLLVLLASVAEAQNRVALVIGNGDYGKVGKLPNPTRDAGAVEELLKAAGFDAVEVKRDLGAVVLPPPCVFAPKKCSNELLAFIV